MRRKRRGKRNQDKRNIKRNSKRNCKLRGFNFHQETAARSVRRPTREIRSDRHTISCTVPLGSFSLAPHAPLATQRHKSLRLTLSDCDCLSLLFPSWSEHCRAPALKVYWDCSLHLQTWDSKWSEEGSYLFEMSVELVCEIQTDTSPDDLEAAFILPDGNIASVCKEVWSNRGINPWTWEATEL